MAWFLCATVRLFAPLLAGKAPAEAGVLRERTATLAKAVEDSCWDGEWYLRAFFDSGEAMGSRANPEAQIDSLPQSWAILSGAARQDRAAQALRSASRHLVREADRLVLLFTPPFDHSKPNPGYIMGYPPGVRENGGQYTHGSLWLAMAWARAGDGETAVKLLKLMNPVECSRNTGDASRYRGEPYVVAADVSSSPGHVGRCGWTWYTGSAGWMYRVWLEEVLGFKLRGDSLTIDPAIPDDWPGFEISFRHRSAQYDIIVQRKAGILSSSVEHDGARVEGKVATLADDGRHHRLVLTLRSPEPQTDSDQRKVTMSGSA
jgi:cyclic beta-1,2-glucan synthetase